MAFTQQFASLGATPDRMKWLAVCSNPLCQWEYVTASPITALLHAHAHNFHLEGQWTHQVHIVNIPAESEQDSFQNAA